MSKIAESEKNSLGLEDRVSKYQIKTNKSVVELFVKFITSNPAIAMASILFLIILLYMMALFETITIYHYLGIILALIMMFGVSLADDARTGYKLFSIAAIFVVIIIFVSI